MSSNSLRTIRIWLAASRPLTLIAAIIPVLLGVKIAQQAGFLVNSWLAIATLGSAMAIQVATNFFNDLIDYQRGTDSEKRIGPKRLVAAGEISPAAMLRAGLTTLLLASLFALPLIWERGWAILVIGIPALYLSYGYTAKPLELAYRGLGELFVILYFGLIAVAGSAYVQSGEFLGASLLLGLQSGFLACTLIAINNLRDICEDAAANKRTLAVKFGKNFARLEICFFFLAPFLIQFLAPVLVGEKILLAAGTALALGGCLAIYDLKERFLKMLLPCAALSYLLFALAFFI